jgi:hypothetical protein
MLLEVRILLNVVVTEVLIVEIKTNLDTVMTNEET